MRRRQPAAAGDGGSRKFYRGQAVREKAGKGQYMENQALIWIAAIGGILAACFSIAALAAALQAKKHAVQRSDDEILVKIEGLSAQLYKDLHLLRQENQQNIARAVGSLGQGLRGGQSQMSNELFLRQEALQRSVADYMKNMDSRFESFQTRSNEQISSMREMAERSLAAMQDENNRRLEQMRATVDEKLQKTLESRIGQSFRLVSERLEQVYQGLGEMQTLAAGVGDLKKVLSNVKTRGVLGEIQLGAILEEILAPGQYEANIATRPGSRNFVEYAVKLPGDGEKAVWLPVDAKFPADAYTQLCDAYESADAAAISAASAQFSARMKSFAKDIREKYIEPPYTTDFAILFLPFEGLYAQAVRMGLLESLQQDYKVSIAGPATMAALLNSLQMGFRTLAIQKRSGEVWAVLGAVKTEFGRFGEVLGAAQQRLEQANHELDQLVGVRTRMIQRRLDQVSALPDEDAKQLLEGENSGRAF